MDFIDILGKMDIGKKIDAKTMENLFCFQGNKNKNFEQHLQVRNYSKNYIF